jgi:hypothetical protein
LDDSVYQSSNIFVVGENITSFTIYIKNSSGCVVVKNYAVFGVKDAEVVGDIAVFPNPVNGLINLKINMLRSQDLNTSILDMLGRVVLQEKVVSRAGEQVYSFNVTQVPDGLYTLHIKELGYSTKILVKH